MSGVELALIECITSASIVDLSHPMTVGMPNHPSHPPYLFTPYLRFGDFELADGYWGTNELIVMSGHSGTHLDSFAHVACDGMLFGGHDAAAEQVGGGIADRGLRHHSIDTVEPIIRRGVLLDVARHHGIETLPDNHGIDGTELAAVEAAADIEVRAGDCVIVYTGQGRYWGEERRYFNVGGGVPGITLDGAEWLATRKVFLVGSDTSVVEQVLPTMETLPVHMRLLAQAGVHLLENMALENLHARAVTEFVFVCLPLLLKGASGSPVRPVAIV